jgi:diguanylate cyclase (GGDEF)-like protein
VFPAFGEQSMSSPGTRWARRDACSVLLMCLLVCCGAWVSAKLSFAVGTVSSIWIANGIISAFVLTSPSRCKIPIFIAGQLANLGVDLALGDTFYPACWFAVCNSAEVLVTVLPLRHFAGRAEVGTRRALLRIGLFGIVLGPLVCALLAAPAAHIIDHRSFLDSLRIWFLADSLGGAATLPCLLFLLTRGRGQARAPGARIADIALASLLVGVTAGVFWQTKYPIVFLLFPPCVAVLFRFKLEGAIYGSSAVLVLAAAFTAEAHGPFALYPGTAATERVMLFQLFGLIIVASCIPVGYVIQERHRLEKELKNANHKLGELALLDALTGVRNRRSFDAVMESEWSSACTSGSDLSLLYIDIDYFKRFNDAYGHQRGDDCLRSVARTLVGSVRGSADCVARYGGEEFVVLLPSTSADSARATADRIAATILELRILHKNSPFGMVTATIGIATVRPSSGSGPQRVIRLADDALYSAKRGGRNRVEARREPAALEMDAEPMAEAQTNHKPALIA